MVKNLKIGNYTDANVNAIVFFPFKKKYIDFKIWKKKNMGQGCCTTK